MERRVRVDGHELVLTHPDRVMWPDAGLTKADLIQYYLDVAHVLIPHLSQRYLVFTRYPNGIQEPGFYQKNCPEHAPAWVRTEPYWSPSSRRTLRFVTGASVATLAWLGNQAAVEIHPWLSRSCSRECPDWAVFDLDPSEPAGLPQARTVAGWLKEALDAFGLRGYLKSSGATGFHVYVPLRPLYTYAQSASFVRYLARLLLESAPHLITLERAVAKRSGKVYIDYLQNAMGKTLVAPYSPRPLPGAPVSAPLDWSELGAFNRPYDARTILPRLGLTGDWLAPVLRDGQDIAVVLRLAGTGVSQGPAAIQRPGPANAEARGPGDQRPAGIGHEAPPAAPSGRIPGTEPRPSLGF